MILINPTTVTGIKNKLPKVKSLGTIAYHLKNLENENIITKTKEVKKQGQPTTYKISSQEISKRMKEGKKEEREQELICLNIIKDNPHITDDEIIAKLKNEGYEEKYGDRIWSDTPFNLANNHLTTINYKITEKGLKYLKKK